MLKKEERLEEKIDEELQRKEGYRKGINKDFERIDVKYIRIQCKGKSNERSKE